MTPADVATARARKGSCVMVVDRVVYDVGTFLDLHPGGRDAIEAAVQEASRAAAAGSAVPDVSTAFGLAAHSERAISMLRRFRLGVLADDTAAGAGAAASRAGEHTDTTVTPARGGAPSSCAAYYASLPPSPGLPFPGPPVDPENARAGQFNVLLSHTLSNHRLAQSWAEAYGPRVSFRIGSQAWLQLSDPEDIRKVWHLNPPKPGSLGLAAARSSNLPGAAKTEGGKCPVKHVSAHATAAPAVGGAAAAGAGAGARASNQQDDLVRVFGTGLLTIDHERWESHRHIARPAFTPQRIAGALPLVAVQAARMRDRIGAEVDAAAAMAAARAQKAAAAGVVEAATRRGPAYALLDMREEVTRTAFDIIVLAVLGPAAPKLLGDELGALRTGIEEAFIGIYQRNLRIAGADATQERGIERLNNFATHAVNSTRTLLAAADAGDGSAAAWPGLDVLKRFAEATHPTAAGGRPGAAVVTDEDIKGELNTLMIAGHGE